MMPTNYSEICLLSFHYTYSLKTGEFLSRRGVPAEAQIVDLPGLHRSLAVDYFH